MKNVVTEGGKPIKLWLSEIEDGALAQAKNVATLPFIFRHVAVMPDSHKGYGVPIGCVFATKGAVIPNAVGVDIGCGMAAVEFDYQGRPEEDALMEIVSALRTDIPRGFHHHETAQDADLFDDAPDIPVIQQELEKARYQIGTLGGGNHFIELQLDENEHLFAMIHSGSRNFGLQIANEYHKKAKKLCKQWHVQLPDPDLAYLPLESSEAKEYLAAMDYALQFAKASRAMMMERFVSIVNTVTGAEAVWEHDIHHNFAAMENHFGQNVLVHRKGATKAYQDQIGIIPGSMGTASYIVKGLGNPESFQSCSHGAGRKMGRRAAQRQLNLAEEQERMAGIVHGLRGSRDLDEAPGSYKDIDVVMENQKDLVEVVHALRPIANVKG